MPGGKEVPVPRAVVPDADRVAVAAAVERAVTRAAMEREGAPPRQLAPSDELARLLAELHATLAGYVDGRRAAGAPIERVIPEVKALVRLARAQEAWCDPAETLMEQVVRWSIATYYAEPGPSHVTAAR
jgi:aminoglycoside phosphotransferase (APT) family kinase protein